MLQIKTTTPDRETAERIAKELVEARVAACVQVSGPVTSFFRWEGRVQTNQEWLCAAKTLASRWPEIEELVIRLHPYDTPELIATPITQASSAYGAWLESESQPESR